MEINRLHRPPSGFGRAFTLIELLVVAGVLMLITVVITQVVLSSVRSNAKSEALREIKQNGDFAIDSLTRIIQNAVAIDDTNCSDAGTTAVNLTVTNPDGTNTVIQCQNTGGVSRIVAVTGARTDIITAGKTRLVLPSNRTLTACTPGNVNTNPLQFVCKMNGAVPGIIQVNFGLEQSAASTSYLDQAYQQFSESIVTRNQYAQ